MQQFHVFSLLFTCARLAAWVMGWKGGGAVWVGRFHYRVVPHCATGHGGRLDIRADCSNARRTCMLSSLAIRGQLCSDKVKETERAEKVSEIHLFYLYYKERVERAV